MFFFIEVWSRTQVAFKRLMFRFSVTRRAFFAGSFLISRLSQLVDQIADDRAIFFAVAFDMWQGIRGGLRYLPGEDSKEDGA